MKLHFHPASTAIRPAALFCAEADIQYEQVVQGFKGGTYVHAS